MCNIAQNPWNTQGKNLNMYMTYPENPKIFMRDFKDLNKLGDKLFMD